MKILLANKYWRQAGGVEVHAEQIRVALEGMGHTVIPFAMSEESTEFTEYKSYFPSEVDFRAGSLPEMARALGRSTLARETRQSIRRLHAEVGFDAAYVIHIYHQLGMAMLNELEALGVPTILSLHDYKVGCANYRLFSERTGSICTRCVDHRLGFLWAPTYEACWSGSRLASAALTIDSLFTKMRRSYRQPHLITTLNSIQERLVAKYANGIPIMRFPHPVELGPRRSTEHRDHFLFIGRLVPEKGLDVVIRAAAATGHRVKVAGEGRSRSELERLVRDLGADVEFLGEVPRSGIEGQLNKAVALLVPSTWHEVSPFVVLEAIAADVPVAASAMGGMPDQIAHGRGYLVQDGSVEDWAQTMDMVMLDQEAAQRRSFAAREFAAKEWSTDSWHQNLAFAFRRIGRPLQ